MKKTTTHQMVKMAFLALLSVLLMLVEFPIAGSPLQFDLSDLPVIIGGVLFGPSAVILIALVKNILHVFFISRNAGIVGELANFAYAVAIAMPLALAYKYTRPNKIQLLVLCVVSVLGAAGFMHFFNYYVTLPLYKVPQEGAWILLRTIYLPFNLIKGSILMVLFVILKPFFDRMRR